MTFQWIVRPEESWPVLAQQQVDGIEADIIALIDGMADEVTQWMRANHRWQNQTGAAEAGLFADIEQAAHQYAALMMSHGPAIPYAWALEASPRTALLDDVVDHFAPVLFRGVQEIVRRHSS